MSTTARIIRRPDAKVFVDGPELCREYVRNDTMWMGTSTLAPGKRGDVDPGHARSIESWYCASGHVLIFDGDRYYELEAGDALEIPPGLPHTLINIGGDEAHLVWAGAPGE
jgi:mannose-6-phosphate isomerase-like protein (cupin superfamily)